MRGPIHPLLRHEMRLAVSLALLCGTIVACGGKSDKRPDSASIVPNDPTPSTTSITGPKAGKPPAGATDVMVTEGDSIFHGQIAGGTCYTCHGADAKGTALAPPLVPHQWLTGDGSYAFIQQRITEGVPNPTPPYPGPMLPMGSTPMSPAQIKAVAAYVYAISRPQ